MNNHATRHNLGTLMLFIRLVDQARDIGEYGVFRPLGGTAPEVGGPAFLYFYERPVLRDSTGAIKTELLPFG